MELAIINNTFGYTGNGIAVAWLMWDLWGLF